MSAAKKSRVEKTKRQSSANLYSLTKTRNWNDSSHLKLYAGTTVFSPDISSVFTKHCIIFGAFTKNSTPPPSNRLLLKRKGVYLREEIDRRDLGRCLKHIGVKNLWKLYVY